MTARVGVIGAGMIGTDHIRRLSGGLTGALVVAVADVDHHRARRQADELPAARAYGSGHALIASDQVDAVLVASPGPTQEAYVLAAIAGGKQVFAEKPPATTEEVCERSWQRRSLANAGWSRLALCVATTPDIVR